MKLLYITRKYPPAVGGMEKVNYCLSHELAKRVEIKKITWGYSQIWLPFFLTKALFQGLFFVYRDGITNIHLGDALLSPLGLIFKQLTRAKVSVTVHGLDVTYRNKFYQMVVIPSLKRLDKIICISYATLDECRKRGIPELKCTVIPWGIYPGEFEVNATREDLERITGLNLKDKKVLITVGRLVKRKGVYWFIENVFHQLPANYIYLIIGVGPEFSRIQELIRKLNLESRIKFLGKVNNDNLKVIYSTADFFVMPNIRVEGDIEGFGMVALEAGSAGLPFIGSELEGVKDVIKEGLNGKLIKPQMTEDYLQMIVSSVFDRSQIKKYTEQLFNWIGVTEEYINAIE